MLLRGQSSFGAKLKVVNRNAVPSPSRPGPDGASYFSGGYNTRRHGSRDGGVVDAIQIESPQDYRLDPQEYAVDLAKAVLSFITEHYPQSL